MKKFGDFICNNKYLIVIISVILFIVSIFGIINTRINYDILVYLPDDIETMKGQKILTDDFNMGSFATAVAENISDKEILKLEDEIREVNGVEKVVSITDFTGTTIPLSIFPDNLTKKLKNGDAKLVLITFRDGTSDEDTLDAVKEIRELTDDNFKLGGMSSMALDTMELSNSEIAIYIFIAVVLCIIVLSLALDSYVVPFILLLNIGFAIIYNMGSNIFLGNISYITKAISSVLQLGVTTDFSIFLYHKYEKNKKTHKSKESAMSDAIGETFTSVVGSSLTTIAGFLALCTMSLTLGRDIGIVMAKGVALGVLSVLILFPAMLLVFDKIIEKTAHKPVIPEFRHLNNFVVKHYKIIFALFLILLVPAWYGNKSTEVYYNLDKSLPDTLESSIANETLKEKFNIVSPEIIIIDKDIKANEVSKMVDEIEKIDGVDMVLSPSKLSSMGISDDMLGSDVTSIYKNDKYQMILVSSIYNTATDELNNQIGEVNKIVKKYDKNGILAGEGPLMKDLVVISDEDFHNVNYTSLIVIFIIMMFVLKSASLPVILIFAIEFAIFMNMGIPYYTNTTIPFIASIVIGTIQLGATIDYAILMTTRYLELRKNGTDKMDAIKDSLQHSTNSIFVSGMCFFAATFGVGVYSKIDMIGTLCTLISRGAIISMIVVITVLPSLLIIFDKLICKTTFGFKKEGKNMKKNIKFAAVTLLIMFSTTDVAALTKNETVYAHLDYTGKVNKVNVNEHLTNISDKKDIEDVTNLKDILNINGDEKFTINDSKITFQNKGNEIYYSGVGSNDLPISMDVTYKLDGKDIDLKKLLGKSGKVEININYKNNSSQNVVVGGSSKRVYTPFVVTMGTIIPTKDVKNVEVTNGRVESTGNNNIVVALATPGLSDSLDASSLDTLNSITITYDVKNFKLNNIYSVVSSKIIDSSDLSVFDKLDEVYKNVDTLNSSSKQLVSGSNQLALGSSKIYNGSMLLKNTLEEKVNSTDISIDDNTKNMLVNMVTSKVMASFTDEKISEIENTAEANAKNTISSYSSLIASLNSNASFMQLLQACNAGNTQACQNENVQRYMLASYIVNDTNAQAVMIETAKTTAVQTAKNTASEVASQISLSVLEQVSSSVKESTMKELSTLVTNLNTLTDAISELNDGIIALNSGMNKFDKEGIDKISSYLSNDIKEKTDTVEELIKLGNNYDTYTMKKSTDDGNTKLVLVIDGEEKKTTTKKTTSSTSSKKTSFIDKIVNIFKK